jgi:hypothetical protein
LSEEQISADSIVGRSVALVEIVPADHPDERYMDALQLWVANRKMWKTNDSAHIGRFQNQILFHSRTQKHNNH